jgi:transposase
VTTEQNIKTNLGGKKITEMIKSQECPKCGSEKIEGKDDKFSCKNCKLSFCCFGAEK